MVNLFGDNVMNKNLLELTESLADDCEILFLLLPLGFTKVLLSHIFILLKKVIPTQNLSLLLVMQVDLLKKIDLRLNGLKIICV